MSKEAALEESGYRYKGTKKLAYGYTTGTCAAAAAQAACIYHFTGVAPENVDIDTPGGIRLRLEVVEAYITETGDSVCAIRKQSGDDPDVTNGVLVYAETAFQSKDNKMTHVSEKERIIIDGGAGVGRVTKPGLDQPVGAAAINSVPRQMITHEVLQVCEEFEYSGLVKVTISIPKGVELAEKTFNPRLGIEGGISVLGTSGIVEPMSEEALVETIRTHLNVLKAEGRKWVIAVPGNMGAGFLERYLVEHGKFCTDAHQGSNAADTDAAVEAEQMAYGELSTGTEPSLLEGFMNSLVTMSNFVGKTIDLAAELGFSGILIAGHMGKLVKIGNGIMNTHSREADGRMDTMLSCALSAGTEDLELLRKIQRSNTTDEAMDHLKQAGIIEDTINVFLKRADWHLTHRSRDEVRTGMIVFGTKGEYLGETEGADAILRSALKELDQ